MCDHGQRIGRKLIIIFWYLIIFYHFCITFDANLFYILEEWRSASFSILKYEISNIAENRTIAKIITYSVRYSLSKLKITVLITVQIDINTGILITVQHINIKKPLKIWQKLWNVSYISFFSCVVPNLVWSF